MDKAIIMGAGPAGLAAGYTLQKNGVDTVIIEEDNQVGGISKTIQYKGFYFDLGGHRFFTKFKEVNDLWNEVLGDQLKKTPRLSRIYYKNKFFNYPLTPMNALFGVGIGDTVRIVLSYIKSKLFPYEEEKTFEQWVSNRFGKKLYVMFFKTYTEKVWGIPCAEIQAEWAAQRIKGLSLTSAVYNALFKPKNTNIKTLIDEFDYPAFGPGMMYMAMGNKAEAMGAGIILNARVTKVRHENFTVNSIEYINEKGQAVSLEGTQFISSIPITELMLIMEPGPGKEVVEAVRKLKYRSLITVDIIVDRKEVFPDNWIYIHSPEVKLGRIQNFKNWSKAMVPDGSQTSLGLEYFSTEGDALWNMDDAELFKLAASEVEKMNLCKASEIRDYCIVRVPKAYPVYDSGYRRHLHIIREYAKKFENLQLIGRYGLFKYNNMDHSILTGLYAAKNIISGDSVQDIWEVNTDEEYHEEKKM